MNALHDQQESRTPQVMFAVGFIVWALNIGYAALEAYLTH